MRHDECDHCTRLRRTGECCHDVFCACRNAYLEAQIADARRDMLILHESNRQRKLAENRRRMP